MERCATTEKVTRAVLLLAGPGSSYFTGATLYEDGGETAT
jgi:NAD(P)-dependent dehydrogenase (short-subunit alcohol dehydrogenase family)